MRFWHAEGLHLCCWEPDCDSDTIPKAQLGPLRVSQLFPFPCIEKKKVRHVE